MLSWRALQGPCLEVMAVGIYITPETLSAREIAWQRYYCHFRVYLSNIELSGLPKNQFFVKAEMLTRGKYSGRHGSQLDNLRRDGTCVSWSASEKIWFLHQWNDGIRRSAGSDRYWSAHIRPRHRQNVGDGADPLRLHPGIIMSTSNIASGVHKSWKR
jgi:hypothetical protein